MGLKKWLFCELDKERASRMSEDLDIPFFLAMILDIRGMTDKDDITDFLSSDLNIQDPVALKDMGNAVKRIHKAIDSFEKICIYGDYDADGVTSTALLYSYLESSGADVMYYIPSRERDGYGLNVEAIKELSERGVNLIITVDNGISSLDEVDFANSLNIDVVITDHHQVGDKLPNAVAVVDPHRRDCESKFKDLAGVGVAFKLVMALEGEDAPREGILENYSDLVAIGTVGDIVPIVGENRVLVKRGLKSINNTDRLGLRCLLEESGLIGKEVNTGNVAFTIVPRINAMGRLDFADKAVELLLSDSYDESVLLSSKLGENNLKRQKIEEKIQLEVEAVLGSDEKIKYDRVLVIDGEDWHDGVLGIVSSKITEKYSKPCIVISRHGKEARGSGRSIKGFSLYEAICSCSELLTKFGGHPMAAGINLDCCNIEEFRKRINDYARNLNEVFWPELKIDCKLNPSALSVELIDQMSPLEPFGVKNVKPVFALCKMEIVKIHPVSGGKHLQLGLCRDSVNLKAMKFGTTLSEFPYSLGDTVDVAVSIDKSEYKGIYGLSIIIKDMKFSEVDLDKILEEKALYEKVKRGEKVSCDELAKIRPSRDDFATIYRYLRNNGGWNSSVDILVYRLNDKDISFAKALIMIDVLSELGTISAENIGDVYKITLSEVDGKVDLNSSRILSGLK